MRYKFGVRSNLVSSGLDRVSTFCGILMVMGSRGDEQFDDIQNFVTSWLIDETLPELELDLKEGNIMLNLQ